MSTPFVSSYYARLIILITEHGTTTCYGVPAAERCKQINKQLSILPSCEGIYTKMECVRCVRTCEACGRSTRVRLVGRRSRDFGIAYVTNPSFP